MKIEVKKNRDQLEILLEGRLDAVSTDSLVDVVNANLEGTTHFTLDLARVDYVSSAGLRVILSSYNRLRERGGQMKLTHVSPEVKNIFDLTGFSGFLTIE